MPNLQEWFQEIRTYLAILTSSSRHKLRADSLSFHAAKKDKGINILVLSRKIA